MQLLTGQNAFQIYPQAPDNFFNRIVEARIVFQRGNNTVDVLVLHQRGVERKATKTI